MEKKNICLGEVKFGKKILVSDPTYKPGTWCALEIDDAKPGIWNAFVSILDNGRVASLRVSHAEYNGEDFAEDLGDGVGVDSGQCGFWDAAAYKKVYRGDLDKFDSQTSEITLTRLGAGVLKGLGVVSATGYGDGGYPVSAARNEKGEIIALEITYIEDEE